MCKKERVGTAVALRLVAMPLNEGAGRYVVMAVISRSSPINAMSPMKWRGFRPIANVLANLAADGDVEESTDAKVDDRSALSRTASTVFIL